MTGKRPSLFAKLWTRRPDLGASGSGFGVSRPSRQGALPCIMCGKDVLASGGTNTIYSGGNLYACHSARRECDGSAGSYDTLAKLERLDEMSGEERERSRTPDADGGMDRSSATAGSSSLPGDEELAARRLSGLVERFPVYVLALGEPRARLMWDAEYVDSHPDEKFFRERFEIREIGRALDRRGGIKLMRKVARRATEVGPNGGKPVPWVRHHLENLWDGIGEWQRVASGDESP